MSKYILLGLAFCVIAVCSFGQTKPDPRWKIAGLSDFATLTYDPKSIQETPDGTITVWLQFKHTAAGILQTLKTRAQKDLPTQGYDKLDSTLHRYEFNCSKRTMRVLSFTDYASDGSTLDSEEFGNSDKWRSVTPDSIIETGFEASCIAWKKK